MWAYSEYLFNYLIKLFNHLFNHLPGHTTQLLEEAEPSLSDASRFIRIHGKLAVLKKN